MATVIEPDRSLGKKLANLIEAIWKFLVVDHLPLRWLYGYDLDDWPFGTKDGYGPFNALATFALGQGAALAAAAKAEYESLAFGLFAVSVSLTACWICAMLRSMQGPLRAFDQPSIRYGRWVLSWTLLLAVLLGILYSQNLLPFQSQRVDYVRGTIQCDVQSVYAWSKSIEKQTPDRAAMDRWIGWLERSSAGSEPRPFLQVQQRARFEKKYNTFTATIEIQPQGKIPGKNLVTVDKIAFLYKTVLGGSRPSYRSIPFRLKPTEPDQKPGDYGLTDTLIIEDPDPDEAVLILMFVNDPYKTQTTLNNSYSVTLQTPFADKASQR